MTNPNQKTESWGERFGKDFPPFIGSGAPFPIFSETPNREHIKSFIQTEIQKAKAETRKEIIKECLEIIDHSIDKSDAYKEILAKLKNGTEKDCYEIPK